MVINYYLIAITFLENDLLSFGKRSFSEILFSTSCCAVFKKKSAQINLIAYRNPIPLSQKG